MSTAIAEPGSREFGQLVREARLRAGLSQAKLANLLGTSVLWLSRIENGRGQPSLKLTRKLAETLNAPELRAAAAGLGDKLHRSPLPLKSLPQTLPFLGHVTEGPDRLAKLPRSGEPRRAGKTVKSYFDPHDPHAFAVKMAGTSMSPAIKDGDLVVLSPRARFRNGKEALVETLTGRFFLRTVYSKDRHYLLTSENRECGDVLLDKERVVAVYPVVAIIRAQ